MKILWIIPKFTFPIDDGARVASNALAKELNSLGTQLDVLFFGSETDEVALYQKKWLAREIIRAPKPMAKGFFKYFSWLYYLLTNPFKPMTCAPYGNSKARQVFRQLLDRVEYDVIVFDGLHGAALLAGEKLAWNCRLVYRAHNVESMIWQTAAQKAKSRLMDLFLRWQARLMERFETNLQRRCVKVWAISAEDEVIFKRRSENTLLVPVGMDFNMTRHLQADESGPLKIFFLGRMDWGPNRDGLKWFLDEVWPHVRRDRSDIELFIAGSGDASWLKGYLNTPQTHFLGRVESVAATYAKMDLSIIPIFYGSGTRIKVIESVSHGVPLLSTLMGVQGSGLLGGDYLAAENPEEWHHLLVNLKRSELSPLREKSRARLKALLDCTAVANTALASLS